MADVDPSDPRPKEAVDEMALGAANATAYGATGTSMGGALGSTATGAVAGQLAADAIMKNEEGRDGEGLGEDNADSGDSFAGEGSPGPVPESDPNDI